ncbi:hypothetical protein [Thermoflavimicrobium dichotomicum]|uniref:Uncharacterized protein n=1 Tax=Thermoflavimicrobium dichotomicum TaxID=46223 RepID=A0A1I3N9S6_9BACL|nr:hypothetical protein [Thermoflavimicrobium dichotomicum]SFJ06038.1 hypothetical protein SAMN05421852_10457 [Thermoflavimicrobium dichotomicum]
MDRDSLIEQHLKQAFYHLKMAVNESAQELSQHKESKQRLGAMWEAFLKQFYQYIREQEKEHRISLLDFAKMFSLRKWFF